MSHKKLVIVMVTLLLLCSAYTWFRIEQRANRIDREMLRGQVNGSH